MAKQAGQSTQIVGIGGQIAGGKRLAQSGCRIVVRWIGRQQVAGHSRLKKAIEGDEAPIDRGGCCGFDTLLGVQTHHERKAAFVEFLARVLAWSRSNGPAAEAGNRGERLGTGARRPLFGFQVRKVPFQGGDGQERGVKRCPVGLGGQPGSQIAERRQVRGDRFLIVAIEGRNEGTERSRVVFPHGKRRHGRSNSSTRRFSDEIWGAVSGVYHAVPKRAR